MPPWYLKRLRVFIEPNDFSFLVSELSRALALIISRELNVSSLDQ
jgi:hypothetical protein